MPSTIGSMPVKVLIADKFSESHLAKLNELGHEVTLDPGLGKDDLPAVIPGYEVLIVRSTKVTPETIDAGDNPDGTTVTAKRSGVES